MFRIGKMLVLFGAFMVLCGLFFMLAGKVPFIGRLPGDISIHTKRMHFYFPLATCLVLSLLFTLIVNIFFRHK